MSGSMMTSWSSSKDYDRFNLKLKFKKSNAQPYPQSVRPRAWSLPVLFRKSHLLPLCPRSLHSSQPSLLGVICAQTVLGPGLWCCTASRGPGSRLVSLPAGLCSQRGSLSPSSPHHALLSPAPVRLCPHALPVILCNTWLVSRPWAQRRLHEYTDCGQCWTASSTTPSSPGTQCLLNKYMNALAT